MILLYHQEKLLSHPLDKGLIKLLLYSLIGSG